MSLHFKSITHPKCPDKKGVVRGETIISGYVFEEVTNAKG